MDNVEPKCNLFILITAYDRNDDAAITAKELFSDELIELLESFSNKNSRRGNEKSESVESNGEETGIYNGQQIINMCH